MPGSDNFDYLDAASSLVRKVRESEMTFVESWDPGAAPKRLLGRTQEGEIYAR
jgi:hypothetical protein